MSGMKEYSGEHLKEIRIPFGGIGAGCVSLNGAGRLVDWEISGYANKCSSNGFTHFAIKAKDGSGSIHARTLQWDEPGSRMGDPRGPDFGCYGFGQDRGTMGGIPHYPASSMQTAWPMAKMTFEYENFPGRAELSAFSPFIPLDSANSSLPAAFFEWEITNTADTDIEYTVCFSLTNPFASEGSVNRYSCMNGIPAIILENRVYEKEIRSHGSLSASVLGEGSVSWQQYWQRGTWFDGLATFWKDFSAGALQNRLYEEPGAGPDTSSLAISKCLRAGERWKVCYVLNWYSPYMENDWSPMSEESVKASCLQNRWRKYYAVKFPGIEDVSAYCITNYYYLKTRTERFVHSITTSTLPEPVLDAALSSLSTLVTPLCLRLEDGSFYGREGLHMTSGSCEGSCDHVWNYAYALCYLFPDLERSMRDLDFIYNMDEDGGLHFRLQLPPGRPHWDFIPCADGQFGAVIKLWRDYLICGDQDWLGKHWPHVKKLMGYAWSPRNHCRWDPDKSGVLTGRQHHTLDTELFGPNSWLTSMYLGALKAAGEIAGVMGDRDAAKEYWDIFEKGKAWADADLFNGEYFCQHIDINDREVLRPFLEGEQADSSVHQYWDETQGELKYQIGEGCLIDQVLGQWHANLCGLGELLDRSKVRSALQSIYKYNYKSSMRDVVNPFRLYCVNDEGGTLICTYPEGRYRPFTSAIYADETMHGFEYQAACHMVQEGLLDQALNIVKSVRDRYDGKYRNPFNEMECGSNYARSMAAFSLLPAYSGMLLDMHRGYIRFQPVVPWLFRCFFSTGSGWGEFERGQDAVSIRILFGRLHLQELCLPFITGEIASVAYNNQYLEYSRSSRSILFLNPLDMLEGGVLSIQIAQ